METMQKETGALLLLKYFGLFRHPLKLEEILKLSPDGENEAGLRQYLDEIVAAGELQQTGIYYQVDGGQEWVSKRLKGERKAAALLPKARKAGRFISWFPFVRFVGISGSLSKGYADEKTDFDFFIITAPDTLWICRTLLHLMKKISFLTGRQHWFCMNYFMDEAHLELEEQNLFLQVELSTLIPVANLELYHRFLSQNRKNLPNLGRLCPAEMIQAQAIAPGSGRRSWWRPLNLLLMRFTDRRWRSKWRRKGFPMTDYGLAFRTTPYISKNHPKNMQKCILNQLSQA